MVEKRGAVILGDKRITPVKREDNGQRLGFQIEHRDGRESAHVEAKVHTVRPEEVGLDRKLMIEAAYAGMRAMGLSREEALRRLRLKKW